MNDLVPVGEHLHDDFLQLPRLALQEVGQAAQTLGALYRLVGDDCQTFASRKIIADMARRPVRCVARDLKALSRHKWIINRGRKKFNRNIHKVRRTNTIMLTTEAERDRKPFLRLPRWACEYLSTWSDRVVFSAILTRHLMLETLEIENDFGREAYSIGSIAEHTGLSVRSVQNAKVRLAAAGFIVVEKGGTIRDDHGRLLSFADEPRLNLDLRLPIPEKPEPAGKCGTPAKGSDTPHRPANVAQTPSKSGTPPLANVAQGGSKSGTRNERELLKRIPKNTKNEHVARPLRGRQRFVDKEQPKCVLKKIMPSEEEQRDRRKLVHAQLAKLLEEESSANGSCH